ncbi:cytochrome c oxidase subunit NDUFA4-like [Heptranchias perlo]|uniref:cytochrome c oxidase subunit NDUFA4-like n=1 Tax=Heptranchias perlo TaxID=212740 RepID=UPI00355A84DC
MLGLVVRQLKSHLGLIPLLIIAGAGSVGGSTFLLRSAFHNPDVIWNHHKNPEPWNKMAPTHQSKLFSVNMDYSKLKKDRPDF